MFFGHFIAIGAIVRRFPVARAALCSLVLFAFTNTGIAAEPGVTPRLHVAVYDVEPYGGRDRDGLFNGASVDLWRRVAEEQHWQYELTLVSRMDDVLAGVERHAYDLGIGAITITPDRLGRVDFSYPTHRSGVAAVFATRTDAVVNSIGALQYLVRARFADRLAPPRGVLAPAYMAFALPMNSALKRPLDRTLTIVSASPEWRSVEDTYFGP